MPVTDSDNNAGKMPTPRADQDAAELERRCVPRQELRNADIHGRLKPLPVSLAHASGSQGGSSCQRARSQASSVHYAQCTSWSYEERAARPSHSAGGSSPAGMLHNTHGKHELGESIGCQLMPKVPIRIRCSSLLQSKSCTAYVGEITRLGTSCNPQKPHCVENWGI